MNVQSTELDEKALSDRVNAIWQNNAADESGDPERDYAVPLLVTAIVVVASLVVCVLFAMHHKRKKRKNLK
jgi:hypothetical protein